MATENRGRSLSTVYEVTAKKPIDTRMLVSTIDDLTRVSRWMSTQADAYDAFYDIRYVGMIVSVVGKGLYRLITKAAEFKLSDWEHIADASEVLTEEEINELIDQKLEGFEIPDEYNDGEVRGLIAGNTERIESLETVVGDSDKGLVKTVNAQAESIKAINETLGKLDETYAKDSDLSSYAKVTDLEPYAKTTFVAENYAAKEAFTTLSNTVNSTSDGLQSKLSIAAAESTYLTKADASTTYAKSADVNTSLSAIENTLKTKLNTDAANTSFMSIETWDSATSGNEYSRAYVKKYAEDQAAAAKTYAVEQDELLKASIVGETSEVLTLAGLLERIKALEGKLNEVSGPAEIQIVAVDTNGIEYASAATIPYDSTIDKFVITNNNDFKF